MMKKKVLSLFAVAAFAVALMAGGAWASTLDIAVSDGTTADTDVDATAAGAYVVGSEWLAGQSGVVNVDLGNALPAPGGVAEDRSDILYTPSIDMGVNNVIVVTVANGALAPNTSYGLWDLNLDTPAKVADLVDFVADSNGNYTSLKFKFSAAVMVGHVLVFTEDGVTPAAANAPELRFTSAQLAAGNMTLQVTEAYDDTSLPLSAPLTIAETVAKAIAQLSAKVQYQTALSMYADGNATSVIDVEATPVSRSQFVAEATGDTPTATTSQAQILVASATVNNGINVNAASYTITLNGDQTAIANVELIDNTNSDTDDFTESTNSWSITSTFADNDLTKQGDNGIRITVDGTTIVDTATYTLDLVVHPDESGVADQQSLDDATAFVWTVNAMQARIPYILIETGGSGYSSFIEITNRGDQAANLSLDAVVSNADGSVNITESQNNVTTVPEHSVLVIREADLDTWLTAVDDTDIYRVGLKLTVVAPQNNVDISAYQKDAVGRTAIPVLYNTNNVNDGRVWQ